MAVAILAVFYIFMPALIIYGCNKSSFLDKIGAGILCYGVGFFMSLIQIIPDGAKGMQEALMSITVPLSIPLMLFSIDLKRWSRLAGKTFLSMTLMFISVLTAAFTGFILFKDSIDGAWQVAGMLIGVYTGGTPNLNAIGLGLKVDEHIIVLTNTADMLACTPWFFVLMIFGQRILNKFLPAFKANSKTPRAGADLSKEGADTESVYERENVDFTDYRGIFKRNTFLPLLKAFFISIIIFGLGGAAYSVAPKEYNMALLMLLITTLGIFCSFIKKIREIDRSFHLGQYIILIFCIVVGSMADVRQLVSAAQGIILITFLAVYGSWLLHLLLCTIFRIDTDTVIITSVAALFSPPFVPIFASALKNREIVVSGLAAGIIGYAVGNYLGISFAYFLKNFFY